MSVVSKYVERVILLICGFMNILQYWRCAINKFMFVSMESIFVISHKISCINLPAAFKYADWRWFCRVETRSKLLVVFVWWLVWSIIFSGNIYHTARYYIPEDDIYFWWSLLIMVKEGGWGFTDLKLCSILWWIFFSRSVVVLKCTTFWFEE